MSSNAAGSVKSPTRTLLFCLVVVALSSVALPYIRGYGTQLFQVVVLGAWSLLAAVTSAEYADRSYHVSWPIAAALNVALFSLPTLPFYFIFRRRWPRLLALSLLVWLLFYLACLFVLFRATDGP